MILAKYLIAALPALLAVVQNDPVWQQEVSEIDAQIEELAEERSQVRGRADRHEDEAMRWQFESHRFTDAKQAWEKADAERQKEQELDDAIKELEKRKSAILNENES